MGNDGILAPPAGNKKIRDELSRDAINSIDRVTMELTIYLWKNIGKIINWISNRLFHMPEIRYEMIGSEDMEEALMRKAFDSLIQRVARPATDIFLSYPRNKLIRLKVLRQYQMELSILDSFIENGRIKSHGIIPFVANGQLGKFHFDLKYEERMLIKNQGKHEKTKIINKNGTIDNNNNNEGKAKGKEKSDRDETLKRNKIEGFEEKESKKVNKFKGIFSK